MPRRDSLFDTTTVCKPKPVNQFFFSRASLELGTFEGKQFLVYDHYQDPLDGQTLVCISALEDDVAACEIFTSGYVPMLAVPDPAVWSLIGVITGPGEIPDFFRYVLLDDDNNGDDDEYGGNGVMKNDL